MKSVRMRWAGHTAHVGRRVGNKVLMGKRERKRALGRPRLRWEDNIKMDMGHVLDCCG
jgi:hypothetical protein